MPAQEIEELIQLLSRLPGLGPRSARRAALHLLKRSDSLLAPLAAALQDAHANVRTCEVCGNLDVSARCHLCSDPQRDTSALCVVAQLSDLWAIERSGKYRGLYHVLRGTLSMLRGASPAFLGIDALLGRLAESERPVREVILALSATVEGQTTSHYLAARMKDMPILVTRLAQGVPLGGELDYLDDGTLGTALQARRPL